MKILRLKIRPLSAFASKAKGDSFFGQFCWQLKNSLGEEKLKELLNDYIDLRPFIVFSDFFPAGHISRPQLPANFYRENKEKDRKELKKQIFLSLDKTDLSLDQWQNNSVPAKELFWYKEALREHNSINRLTGSTDSEGFAPWSKTLYWFNNEKSVKEKFFDLYVVYDPHRIEADIIKEIVSFMGQKGFGKDASTGMGKFEVAGFEDGFQFKVNQNANAVLSLAPMSPQKMNLKREDAFYQTFTRFGRHGDAAVFKNPFKNPVLMADTAALFKVEDAAKRKFCGAGFGKSALLSKALPETVHQAYAPIIPVYCEVFNR